MRIVGRQREYDVIEQCLLSGRPEFVAVYGRRRVGKTFLVREFFNGLFSFLETGIDGKNTTDQLRAFHASLQQYRDKERKKTSDWFEALDRMRGLLCGENVPRDTVNGRRVVFLDESMDGYAMFRL